MINIYVLPGQISVLQVCDDMFVPVHSNPYRSGAGSSQYRALDWVPPLQDCEHSDQSNHEPQLPWTEK